MSVKAENIKGRAVGRERYATAREVDNDTGGGQAEKSKTTIQRERERTKDAHGVAAFGPCTKSTWVHCTSTYVLMTCEKGKREGKKQKRI